MIRVKITVWQLSERAPRVSGDDPNTLLHIVVAIGAPRVSGDDPYTVGKVLDLMECSPRERG